MFGIVVENYVQATTAYVRHGGHVFMRLLSDAMSVRCLNDIKKNFTSIVPANSGESPILIDVGFKARANVSPATVPGVHVRVRPSLD